MPETLLKTDSMNLEGLHCSDCAATIEKTVAKMAGVAEVSTSLSSGKLKISYNPIKVSYPDLVKCVEKIGYRVKTGGHKNIEKKSFLSKPEILTTAISGSLLGLGLLVLFLMKNSVLLSISGKVFTTSTLLFISSTLFGTYYFSRSAWAAIKSLNYSISALMLLAIVGAIIIGEYVEAASLAFLFSLAELLEAYAVDRARNSLRELMKLTPDEAMVKRGNDEITLAVSDILVGEIFIVRPGEKIALDGTVASGESSVDQSPITGESVPISKKNDDVIYAGSINNEGYLEVKVTKNHENTTLARIIHLVEEAESKKAPIERFVEKFAKIYSPIVILLAIGVMTIPPFFLGEAFTPWFLKALTLLVISCPCALVISTPVSVVSALTSASRNGALIKGGIYLEQMSKIKVVAFDKTGTLTKGKLKVTDVRSFNGIPENEILYLAAALEQKSEHPIARAIRAETNGKSLDKISEFKAIAGKGVRGKLNGKNIIIGREELFLEEKYSLPEQELSTLQQAGKTTMLIGDDREIIGVIALADQVRDDAGPTIAQLKKSGRKVVMITGDNPETAKAIANKIGIEKYHAGLLPEDKVKIVQQLEKEFGKVAMVGDGINDAPALATATIGIAMGAAGSDAALETADIALMSDDLTKLIYLIALSKKANAVIQENTLAAILIKFTLAIGVFPGLVSLVVAVLVGDMGASLGVTTNAMRLARFKMK